MFKLVFSTTVALTFFAGTAFAYSPETIHVYTDDTNHEVGAFLTEVHRGEPATPGPPPSVYVDGEIVNEAGETN